MMNESKTLFAKGAPLVGLLALLLASGCQRPIGELELTAYKDPVAPQTFEVKLWEGAYYIEPGKDYHIVGRATHKPAEEGVGEITQVLHIHMFWRPHPGKTFDNASMIDATLRYAIITDQGSAIYNGTAYVYAKKVSGDRLKITLEGGRLQLAAQEGQTPDIFGAARIKGELRTLPDSGLTMELRREIDLRTGRDTAHAPPVDVHASSSTGR